MSDKAMFEFYSRSELQELWRNFKDEPDAVQILSDFANTDRRTAACLVREFQREEMRKLVFQKKE